MCAFLGWLRGEKRHCSMVTIPRIEEEDASRRNRERQNLVSKQTRIVNQMNAIFARFRIRTIWPTMRKAEGKLKGLHTAEGTPLPENKLLIALWRPVENGEVPQGVILRPAE